MRTAKEIQKLIDRTAKQIKKSRNHPVNLSLARLEQSMPGLRRELKRAQEKETADITGVTMSIAGDYAAMDTREFGFYYGYEHTICQKHGDDSGCESYDCNQVRWAFVATDKRGDKPKEIFRADVGDYRTMERALLMGIGHFLNRVYEIVNIQPDKDTTDDQ